jgi:L-ribulose-5-phosphate 4-epimerase
MGIEALTLEPALGPISADLLEKHFARKHGAAAYYGQGSAGG